MANNLKIVITAVDQATASVRRINASIARITAPVNQVRQSIGSLGRELGLDKVGKSLGRVAGSAKQVAGALGSIVAPLAGVIGVGSVAGVAALATEWGRMGIEVANTSRNLGVTTSQLQGLRGAAQVAGIGSDALAGGLQSLGDTINDARWGRNQGAVALMAKLGIGFHRTADGSVDVIRSLKDLSTAVGQIGNVETQRMVARQFGVEALLPLLRKGGNAIDEYQKKADALGAVQSPAAIEQAQAFGLQLNYLGLATQGLRNSIAERLMPILTPLLEQLTNWIAKNRELIATKVVGFVKSLVDWLKRVDFNKVLDGVTRLIDKISGLVDSLGGLKGVAIVVGALMTANILAPVISLTASLASLTATTIPAAVRALALLRGAGAAAQASTAAAAAVGTVTAGAGAGAGAAVGAGEAAVGAGAAGAGAIVAGSTAGIALLLAALGAASVYVGYKGAEYFFGKKPGKGRSGGGVIGPFTPKQTVVGSATGQGVGAGVPALPLSQMTSKADLARAAQQQWVDTFGKPRTQLAPLGIRSNNPLNIQRNGGEATYPTMQAGIAAAYADLYGKIGRGINTPAMIVNRWSPPNAEGNSARSNANYVKSIEDDIGSGPINRDDPRVMAKLLSAMARFENGSAGADKGGVDDTIKQVLQVEFKNAPPGTTATAKTLAGNAQPVQIVMAMPGGGMP